MLKNRNNPDQPVTREAPKVISFDVPETAKGQTAPVDLTFQAVTGKDVEGIRLRGEDGRELNTEAFCGDNADGKRWMINMHLETGFAGTVTVQVRREGEEEWYDTEHTAEVEVSSPLGNETAAPAEPTPTPDPDDDDYYNPDETESPEDVTGQTGADTPEEEDDFPAGELKTPEPTATPAPVTPEPTATPALTAEAASDASPDRITNITVWTGNTKKVKDYARPAKELIHMPAADEYTKKQLGVMTFRGDNFRRNAAVGTLSAEPDGLGVLWQTEAGTARGEKVNFYGYQWTGQPVIARWSTEVRAHANISQAKAEKKALKEVIIAGVDGAIRFLDLEDGKITRSSIKLGYAMRGTPSLHTRGYPFMSVGQYARKMKNRRGNIGLRQYNLFTQGELELIDGLDGKYHRPLNDIGSFETSALIDRESDTLIAVGTNGALYLEALNSNFDYNTGIMTISPSVTVMTSRVKGQKSKALLAVESSPAAYDKYVFYADMGGVLRCVDTNTLRPVWAVDTGDSVMAAVAMDMTESQELNLYTANMLNNRKKGDSQIQIRRYDALSGSQAWSTDIGVHKGKKDKDDVGAKASPVIGQQGLKDLVYFTVTGLSDEGRRQLNLSNGEPAALIALEKETGRVVWAFGLNSRSESSPIALYDNDGNGWIVQCEQKGIMYLLEGRTGRQVSSLNLEAQIEASPAAYNNVVVIGTTGKGTAFVYGIEVKLNKAAQSAAAEENNGQAAENQAAEDQAAENQSGGAEEAGPDEESGDGREDAQEDYMEEFVDYDGAEEEGGTEDEEDSGGA